MDPLTITAGAGLRARAEALDMLANNLANASTAGFKADRAAYSLFQSDEGGQSSSPLLEQHKTDFSQGQLRQTGDLRDVSLEGKGFFLVDSPDGPLLTRNGSFRISSDGKLTTPEGYEFASADKRRIRAVPGYDVNIDADGVVRQRGEELGRLKLVDTASGAQPARREGAYFSLDKRDLPGLPPAKARVQQGKVEAANFSPAEASIRLVSILRQFETMQKALQIGGEMGRRAVDEVARVHP